MCIRDSIRGRPNRAGEVWSVEIPEVETPLSITRYVRKDTRSSERPVRAHATGWELPRTKNEFE
eukprot:14935754-Alexandrium_andersonii.AAC.1